MAANEHHDLFRDPPGGDKLEYYFKKGILLRRLSKVGISQGLLPLVHKFLSQTVIFWSYQGTQIFF